MVKDGQEVIVNHYKTEFFYRGDAVLDLFFATDYPDVEVFTPQVKTIVKAQRKSVIHLFFRFPPSFLQKGRRKIKVYLRSREDGEELFAKEISLIGPYR